MSEDPNVTFKQMNTMWMNSESEKQQYESISEMNLKEITDSKNRFLHMLSPTDSNSQQKECLDRYLQIKQEHFINKAAFSERNQQIGNLKNQIKKKMRLVDDLQARRKDLAEELDKFKLENENVNKQSHTSFQIFQKALKFYTQYFQYVIKINEEANLVTINFVFGKKKSHPIRFSFDKQENKIVDFSADGLLTTEQQTILLDRFKETDNNLALFSTLRKLAHEKSVAK